jgi:hypothetical protein
MRLRQRAEWHDGPDVREVHRSDGIGPDHGHRLAFLCRR